MATISEYEYFTLKYTMLKKYVTIRPETKQAVCDGLAKEYE
jgi:hypothetical protein